MSGSNSLLGIVVGILVVASAHVVLNLNASRMSGSLRETVLCPKAERATALSVTRSDGEIVRLARDGDWKIVSPCEAPADRNAVLRLLDLLAFAQISTEMTDAELLRIGRTRRDFGLDAPRLVVGVGEVGDDDVRVSLGNSTPAGDGVYASVSGRDVVYVVPTNVLSATDLKTDGFRCRHIVTMEGAEVSSVDVKGAGRFVRVVRDGEKWRLVEPHDGMASSLRVGTFLDELTGLRARSFVWPTGASNETRVASVSFLAGFGLDPDSAVTVTLKSSDGGSSLVSFGNAAGSDAVYALVGGGSTIVTVPSSVRATVMAGVESFVDSRLFPVDASSVDVLSLDDGGTTCLLSCKAEGCWRIDAPISAVADQEVVKALLGRLVALRGSDRTQEGVHVSIGKGVDPVVVSREALFAGLRIEDLRSKEILRVEADSVKRIVVTDRAGTPVSVLYNASRREWMSEDTDKGVLIDGDAVSRLVSMLEAFKAVRVVGFNVSAADLGAFGLDAPIRTVAVDQTVEGAVRRNILIGDVTDGGRYATLGAADAVFVISPECAAALLAPITK